MAFSPLDEELGITGRETDATGTRTAGEIIELHAIRTAVELFEDFMGIHVSKDVGQRYTEEAGAVYEELQTEEVEELHKKRPKDQSHVRQITDQRRWMHGAVVAWGVGGSEDSGDRGSSSQ